MFENSEFTNEELEVQELMKETNENESVKEMGGEKEQIELSSEIQALSAGELRKLASNEFAEHGKTALREEYLKLAEIKENSQNQSEISFGSGRYNGKTSKEWLAEEKIEEIKRNPTKARVARENANKAAQYDI